MAAQVHEETTEAAIRPALTDLEAVENSSEDMTSRWYRLRAQVMKTMTTENPSPAPTNTPYPVPCERGAVSMLRDVFGGLRRGCLLVLYDQAPSLTTDKLIVEMVDKVLNEKRSSVYHCKEETQEVSIVCLVLSFLASSDHEHTTSRLFPLPP